MSRRYPKAVSDYYLGILYGDGYYQADEKVYFFSTTVLSVANILLKKLNEKNIKHRNFQRHHETESKKNYELLEIIEITDTEFIEYLRLKKMFNEKAMERFKCNSQFIRGYLETKGTFFFYNQRGNDAWRVAFSGNKDDLQILHTYLVRDHGINCSQLTQRKEREDLNIVSNSFRFAIQNRKGIAKFVSFIETEYDLTGLLKEKIEAFNDWHSSRPFNMVKQYKHYRYATITMAKHLGLDLHGIRGGGGGGSKQKPIYLWEEEKPIKEFKGWQGAYEWIKEQFEEQGLNPPIVVSE